MPVVIVLPPRKPRMYMGFKKSFHIHMPKKITAVAVQGLINGKMILKNVVNGLAPSIKADSSKLAGMVLMNPTYRKIVVLKYVPA